jgi:thioesterase domain-containing protein/aryl carrier-like protein
VHGSGADTEEEDATAGDDLVQRLRAIWEDVLDVRPVRAHDDFFELGGHSLLAIKLLDRVDRQFGRALGLATMFQAPTLGAQADLLREGVQAPGHCAVAVRAEGRRPPLFFVSGYGGAILPFHALAKELDAEQPLYVLDVNSIDGLDASPVKLESVAAGMIRDLRRVQPHGPYHLAGFSLGGKIVYEMAQQLQRAGEEVGLLALLDCMAPGAERLRSFPVRVLLHVQHALRRDPREAAAYLLERVRRLKKYFGLAERVQPTVFKSHQPVDPTTIVRSIEARARPLYEAWRAYEPGPYPGRLLLIRAEVRDYMPGVVADDRSMGWSRLIAQGVEIVSLNEARHEDMLDARHAPALAALLDAAMARSASRR